jgi:hypothetical protein
MGELDLAGLLEQQKATGWDPNAINTPGPAGRGLISPGQAALGASAMKNIAGMAPAPEQLVMPGGAGIAPRGQQIQLAKPQAQAADIDPRVKLGLAQLLFGGK